MRTATAALAAAALAIAPLLAAPAAAAEHGEPTLDDFASALYEPGAAALSGS